MAAPRAAPPSLLDADVAAQKSVRPSRSLSRWRRRHEGPDVLHLHGGLALEKTKEGLVRMCSCRGTGFVHVSCLGGRRFWSRRPRRTIWTGR